MKRYTINKELKNKIYNKLKEFENLHENNKFTLEYSLLNFYSVCESCNEGNYKKLLEITKL